MKRQDWVWAFAKAFGIYLLAQALLKTSGAVSYFSFLSEETYIFSKAILFTLAMLLIYFASGLILLLRTDWVFRIVRVMPKSEEESETSNEKPHETTLITPEGRNAVLWVFIKGLGIYFVAFQIISIPVVIMEFSFSQLISEVQVSGLYIQVITIILKLGIGICLIIFTGFFVRLVTKYGLLSGLKDKLKYAGEEE